MHSSIASVRLLLQHGANPEAVIGVSQNHDVLTKKCSLTNIISTCGFSIGPSSYRTCDKQQDQSSYSGILDKLFVLLYKCNAMFAVYFLVFYKLLCRLTWQAMILVLPMKM
jgi:hypothetical protein